MLDSIQHTYGDANSTLIMQSPDWSLPFKIMYDKTDM